MNVKQNEKKALTFNALGVNVTIPKELMLDVSKSLLKYTFDYFNPTTANYSSSSRSSCPINNSANNHPAQRHSNISGANNDGDDADNDTDSDTDTDDKTSVKKGNLRSEGKKFEIKAEENKVEKKEREGEEKKQSECDICCEKEKNTCLIPCGHILCSNCTQQFDECPYCRKHIDSTVRIYF